MNRNLLIIPYLLLSFFIYAQSPIGIWKNLDDEDGREKSHIEIYEQNGTLRGKVIKLLPAATITKCDKCTGANKGKVYDCKIELDGTDKLKVRGFVGVSMFGRTQIWYKVK